MGRFCYPKEAALSDEALRAQDGSLSDVERIVGACAEHLRPQDEWTLVTEHPGSLALAVISSIWSIETRYPIARGVIGRYRTVRMREGADPSKDSLTDLLGLYERLGGVTEFIDKIGTRNRVSTQPDAPSRGQAVLLAAKVLVDLGIDSAEQFVEADETDLGRDARDAWLTVPGQEAGISWRYLRMLLGLPDVKPDRMIVRFVAAGLGVTEDALSSDTAAELVKAAAERTGADLSALDHEIWEYQAGYRGNRDLATTTDHLRTVARAFVGAALPALAELRVVPASVYRPFLRVGNDYEGSNVMGLPEFTELEAAVQRLLPERFMLSTTPPRQPNLEFANSYIFGLLEAAIARCAVALADFEADNELVGQTIEDWLALLEAGTEQLHCCRVVSHVTTETDEPVKIGEITVSPETGPGSLLERTQEMIPRALDERPPHTFDPPQSLVIATTSSSPVEAYAASRRIEGDVDRFLLLARLLLAGTHQSCWEITGPASSVSKRYPAHHVFGKGAMSTLMQRVVKLNTGHAPAFAALGGYLDAAKVKRAGKVTTTFDVALYRFNRAHEAHDDYEAIVDLATALEAVLISDGNETDAISLRLRGRAAALLVTEVDSGRAIFEDVGRLYKLRSKLVHGGSISEKDLRDITTGLSTAPSDMPPRVSLAFAVDRMRDLVRRAFLARLCLAAEPDALWPFGQEVPVDAMMADEHARDAWRQRWRGVLADLGVPEAAEAAAPGVDPLRDDSTTQ
ncbi:hypothetical protein Caci_8931 [Catenulispora acidiphila DSM 44928]|uniref:Uncharacterized protein n=1 Tax=Catenulispora acidiphila (strain DSM 44928 / JCM 14897 / NBRC 102108 / NRRL B-24433 / ID139908) TaxID=479433 RepID=C7Q3Y6_CATAD|nr:hypothetical protein Caci_8931 [Catenulispora acidiphila DSM 44928]